jgi:hypothetical protein
MRGRWVEAATQEQGGRGSHAGVGRQADRLMQEKMEEGSQIQAISR